MTPPPTCPACHTLLQLKKSWLGLRRTYPSRCQACGVKLAYDTVGGIYVLNEPAPPDEEEKSPRQ